MDYPLYFSAQYAIAVIARLTCLPGRSGQLVVKCPVVIVDTALYYSANCAIVIAVITRYDKRSCPVAVRVQLCTG